jgi:hypothetical protein
MRKLIFVFAFVFAAFHFTSAQSAQSVYFELGGPGIASFNYDTRFSGREGGIGGRIGAGYSKLVSDGISVFYLPLGINYLIGKEKHFFELGAGVTPGIGNENGGDTALSETFGHLLFGYRFQPINNGFTFRAFVCPVFNSIDFIPYYAGLSAGYKF